MSEPKPLLAPLRPPSGEPRLWTAAGFVADPWRTIDDETPLPIEGRAIISLARWRADQASLAALSVPVGVKVQPSEQVETATDDIDRLGLIALAFPKFTDGRAYSTARRLREQGFKGEIRAVGDVLLDQIPLMLRCGFDTMEIAHVPTMEALARGIRPGVTRVYQSGAARATGRWLPRRRDVAAAARS